MSAFHYFAWARATITFATVAVLLGLAACSDFETVPAEAPTPLPPPSPAQLAAHVPTFDIAADPAAFAEMMGRYGEDIEIDAAVSMWRDGRAVLSAEPAEIQIRGNASAGFALKSLGVKLDDAFDNADGELMRVPRLLAGHSLAELRNFRLRNGGNDFTFTLLKDLGYARMVAASDLAVVPYYGEPAAAFVNGAFYGLLNLRTEGNANGLSRLLGTRKRDLVIAEVNNVDGATEAQAFEVKDGNEAVFRDLERAIRDGDREAAMSMVDERSLIDFTLVHTVFAVADWPWNNVKVYGERGGRLKFMAFDFDLATERHADEGLLFHVRERKPNYISDLFALAYEDDGFRERFWDRRDALLASEALAPERLRENFESLAAAYAAIIDHQIATYGYPTSRAAWYLRLERYVEQYEARYHIIERERRE